MGTTGGLMTQTQARQLAKRLSDSTGMAHVAHTVPQGCWGGTERGWAVTGPAIGLDLDLGQASKGPGPSLAAVQAEIRAQLIEDARARLRQAERAQDWRGMIDATAEINRLSELGP